MNRFKLNPLPDAPLPDMPNGPISQLPEIDFEEPDVVRFVSTAGKESEERKKRIKRKAAEAMRADAAPADAGATGASLYGFNIEELYDYDLPNIRKPSETLTAMASQKLRSPPSSRGAPRLPPLPASASDIAASPASDATESPEGEGEAKLKTGDEAANFFARNGNHTPVKFVYLNRAKTGDAFRPYDLVVVSREQVDTEYFTMSAMGVVHVYNERQPSEFIQLSTWMQQSTFFNVLTSIRFFKHYLVAKIFRLWRANVRYKLYQLQRNKLCRRLFLAKPAFCSTLLEINALCYELRTGDNTRLMAPVSMNFTAIDTFLEEQSAQRTHAAKAFEQIVDKLQALIEKVCNDVTTRAKMSSELTGNGEDGASGEHGAPAKQRSKSMSKQKEEQQARLAAVRQAAAEAQMLGDFIRLADYMTVSCCFLLTVNTAEKLLDIMTTTRKNGLFLTTVEFGADDMIFSPPERQINGSLEALIEGMITTIHAVPRLLYTRAFKSYFHSGRVEGPDVVRTIRKDEYFIKIQAEVESVIVQDFRGATEYAQQFEEYRVIHCFGEHWNFDAYAARAHTQSFKETAAAFRQDMHQLNKWYRDLDRMRMSGTTRNLHIDSKTLKNSLVPVTQKALDKCRGLLLQVAKDQCLETLQIYNQRLRDLGEQPRTLRDFADYCENLNQVIAEAKEMEERAMKVNDMYDLLEQYEVKIPSTDAVKKDDLKEAREALNKKAEEAELMVDGKMGTMTQTLEKSIGNLNEELIGILAQLHDGDYVDPLCDPKLVLDRLQTVNEQLISLSEKAEGYKQMQATFHMEAREFTQLRDTIAQYELKLEMWQKLDTWNDSQYEWKSQEFMSLNVEAIAKEVATYSKDVQKMSKRLAANPQNDSVISNFKESVEDFKDAMPVIADLGNPALQDRHWKKIFDKLEQTFYPGTSFTMEQLIRYGVLEHADFIKEISGTASGEYGLEQLLERIRKSWAEISFTTINHRDQSDIWILGGIEDVVMQLEDSQVALQTILASRFVGGIRTEVEEWEKKLSLLSEMLDEWLTCQRSWMYLENIFGAEDIQKQLPVESAKFSKLDKFFKERMRKCHEYPNVIGQVTVPNLLDNFIDANKQLDEIQKSLEDYLETKRAAFARFYFLSNDELLEILSQTRDPHAVQPHLIKCFDAVKRLSFGEAEDAKKMYEMISGEGEKVSFSIPPVAEGPVEQWLLKMQTSMCETLYDQCKLCLQQLSTMPRDDWYFAFPAQCILMIGQIEWTNGVTQSLDQMQAGDAEALQTYNANWIAVIDSMVQIVRRQLTPLQRQVVGAKLVIDVHARDTVSTMIREHTEKVSDFEWMKQLRYYWEEDIDDCAIRQTNTYFRYGYEYLGNSMRLVITPLTDKCYMTLTGALNLGMGGAPAGPAGTGKTETTKDLAKALARQCVVMNCSDQLDYKIMGRFFSGLAQSGAWACFDEFNRIDIEVLSVIAQQVLTIQEAVKMKAESFIFEGREITLNPGYGVFITMNPGYAGRAELPDNLKALFRPVAMMIPDYRLIAEIMLFSEGFGQAKPLSNKMTQLYRLSSEQLSKQDHYDFGMRAVKSVLVMAGGLKRANPTLNEDITLIRALRDSNLPKFLYDDLPLFTSIIQDLFPAVEIPSVDYGMLQVAIEHQLRKASLQPVPSYVAKVIQLFETMLVRHGVMVVGLTLTGKTECHAALSAALSQLKRDGEEGSTFYEIAKRWTLNPKAVQMGELYGEVNPTTQEWTDGLVPTLVRQAIADDSDNLNWVVFDGPVDALWIENMNTVLDDNKMLCLSNGERMKLAKTMHMMFEVNDLAVASPATVSRCGMVFMEAVYIGHAPYIKSWCETFFSPSGAFGEKLPAESDRLLSLLLKHCPNAIKFIREECREGTESADANLLLSCFRLLESTLKAEHGVNPNKAGVRTMINLWFIFAFVWAFGGNLHEESRGRFDKFVRASGLIKELDPSFPDEGTVFDYCVSPERGGFVTWISITNTFSYDPEMPYFNILVPTGENTASEFLLRVLVANQSHVMLVGETGTGKSVLVQSFLKKLPDTANAIQAAFSAQTSAKNMQDLLESKLEKLRKNLLGSPPGRQTAIFVDDINMPALEQYGAQPPIELVRQTLSQGGFYDLKKLFFKRVQNTSFIAACGPPGGGRNAITQRLIRHFNLLWLPELSVDAMQGIFDAILGGFLSVNKFDDSIQDIASAVVQATVSVYNKMRQEMLPTPSKSHYTFNLRDVSRVMQGCLQITKLRCMESDAFLRLWCHESSRVFCDRLINKDDRDWFVGQLKTALSGRPFKRNWSEAKIQGIIFGMYMNTMQGVSGAVYEEVELKSSGAKFNEYLQDYNLNTTKPMNLVFFDDCITHLARISRIITQPRGCALLVGVGGSGRQSLVRLAASMWEYRCAGIEITRTYDTAAWRDDLKSFMFMSGCESQPVVFLFSDTQIVKESMLEDINNILNSGEVPNLFETEDMERIMNSVRPLAKAAGKPEGRDAIYSHFVQLVRENLHIALCVSPIGDAFRVRCRMFPSLINCCTIDWFDEWPKDALLSVAERYFEKVDVGSEENKRSICEICVEMHYSVGIASDDFFSRLRRKTYTTPTSYLELLNLYCAMLKEQREMVVQKISHYSGGVNKLVETNVVVDRMKKELVDLQPVLAQAAKDTQKLLAEVAADQASADEVKARVSKEEAQVGEIAKEAQAIAADAQRDLDEAMPAFHAAVEALKSLNKSDIQEIKAYKTPPDLVQLVCEAVCILLGSKPDWGEAKRLLSDMNFLEKLQDYDKDNIPEKYIKGIQKYVKNEKFYPDTIGKVSKASKSLCMWVRAMDTYARVAKTVEPKKAALKAATDKLKESQAMLKEKQAALNQVEQRVLALKRKLDDTQAKAKDLEEQERDTQTKLERAGKLVGGLGSEKVRWEQLCRDLADGQSQLVGNMIVCAGAIAYQGPFTAAFRSDLNHKWVEKVKSLGIDSLDNPTVGGVLADPVTVREWAIFGLPQDSLSVENAIFVTRSRRWPLMVDPQGQANRWVKNMEKEQKLRIIKLTQGDFLRVLEGSIRVGIPVLLENVQEQLDPALDPILLKQTYKSQGRTLIRLGDTDVDYSEEFKFYITSTLSNPHYAPEVCIKITVVNFTVTFEGLEDQLLAEVASIERPDLEAKKESLVVSIADGRRTIKKLEDEILRMLAESSGNILDDELLINTLDSSKKTSAKTEASVKGAEETMQEIAIARENYRPVATLGSILYFVVSDFASVDPMYLYSLQYFKEIFAQTVHGAQKNDDLQARLKILLDAETSSIFKMICRGLFEKDKTLFAFMIATSMLRKRGEITAEEWAFFLKTAILAPDEQSNPPGDGWLDDRAWTFVNEADAEIEGLNGLKKSLSSLDNREWKTFATSEAPQTHSLPAEWEQKCTAFQRLLLIKIFRPEKVSFASVEFVGSVLGQDFKEAPPFDLLSTYKDSACKVPIVFVLTSGADPTQYLLQLGKQQGFIQGDNLKLVSLGQGQGPIAERLMAEGQQKGNWVCLQNCHLAVSWLPRLDKLLEELRESDSCSEDFRLWLTTMPTPKFPGTILQSALKLTQEPPKGLKANMTRSYIDIDAQQFESCEKPAEFKKLMFGLVFFNAVIQERRKYGAIGWNIPYQWMTSDLTFAQANLKIFLDEPGPIPFEALIAIISDVIYGGRVTDKQDVRLTTAILQTYVNAETVENDSYSYCPQLDDRFQYWVPPEGDLESYKHFIATFPLIDSPEIFGLHVNADISYQTQESNKMLETIISLQPRAAGGGGGKSPDETVREIADDLASRMPQTMDAKKAHADTFFKLEGGSINPLGIFLSHELHKFNTLIKAMQKLIKELLRALKGLVVMSAQLDAAYSNLMYLQVPVPWGEFGKGYPSLKPLASWYKDFLARVSFINEWLVKGPPASFWVSSFFFPQGFFTSALQAYARKYKEPIDLLEFIPTVKPFLGLEDVSAPPNDGVYIHGLFMEGARFDTNANTMAESLPAELFAPVNVMHLMPARNDTGVDRHKGMYECPFYKTNVRAGTLSTTGHSTNHVCNFLLPSNEPAGHWTRRGCAIISMTND